MTTPTNTPMTTPITDPNQLTVDLIVAAAGGRGLTLARGDYFDGDAMACCAYTAAVLAVVGPRVEATDGRIIDTTDPHTFDDYDDVDDVDIAAWSVHPAMREALRGIEYGFEGYTDEHRYGDAFVALGRAVAAAVGLDPDTD
jgi:hypothetical protein